MLASLLTGLGAAVARYRIPWLCGLALIAGSIYSGASAQTRELPFIVNSTTLDGRSCLTLPWPNAIWVSPRVPAIGDRVLFGTACNNATVRQITATTPLTQTVVTCNAQAGDTAQQCSNRGESSEPLSTYLTPPPPPAPRPTATITASPTSVVLGNTSTLTWTSTDAASCSAGGAWSGALATSGAQVTAPLAVNSTYSLTCQGAGGFSDVVLATVNVTNPPVPACLPQPFGGGSAMLYRDTKLADGTTDPAGPAAMLFFCGAEAHWLVGTPGEIMTNLAIVWASIPWRAPTDAERAFVAQFVGDSRP
jgi:hypothetical protein